MHRISLSVCIRCRCSVFDSSHPERWLSSAESLITRRFRSETKLARRPQNNLWLPNPSRSNQLSYPPLPPKQEFQEYRPLLLSEVPKFFRSEVVPWSKSKAVHGRLESFGIPYAHIRPLLAEFVSAVRSGSLSTPENFEKYRLSRLAQYMPPVSRHTHISIVYTSVLYTWASDPNNQIFLERIIPRSTLTTIQKLAKASEREFPEFEYTNARKLHRKVIMHVGPTNSGKTHHALRALAAAKSGVYAGPLRLLAHEIWERLNLGQIVPLGMDEAEPTIVTATKLGTELDSALDVGTTTTVRRLGNPLHAKKCNMMTGEEHKIVDEAAPLLSCTVEMLNTERLYDVAVIDEIQMISDDQRGSGWTNAVLGICAREVHLCGEETAVPLVRALLKNTGDEIEVRRYNRLTPLMVEEKSLDGDLSLVRKGDCIVTFSRSSILGLKRRVEEQTGLRCAVVYGRLPPELRSEQAALFNDPDSGYDVMIGSDAIGMGLNLKIRRIIFEAVRKWDGDAEHPLSISQIKQIAGRAGRYGLHGDQQPGGFVTTLHSADLPFLCQMLDAPAPPLECARIGPSMESFVGVASVLPKDSSVKAIYHAHTYTARLQPIYRYADKASLDTACSFVDKRAEDLTLADKALLMLAPVPWRDDKSLEIVSKFVNMYIQSMNVDLMEGLQGTDYMETLLHVEEMMKAEKRPKSSSVALGNMETFHKVLVLYIWMSFRNPVAYNNYEEMQDLKTRLEVALDWSLEGMSKDGVSHQSWSTQRNSKKNEVKIAYSDVRELLSGRTARWDV